MTRPLDGIRMVAFGSNPAAAMTGMLLADHGAEVTSVRRPGAHRLYPAGDVVWMRGHRAIDLDLTKSEGLAAARELIAAADVVVENFRPGVMRRFGLDADSVQGGRPSIVYCSMPGFSATDEARRDVPGWEGLIQAATAATHPWFEGATGAEPPAFNTLPSASAFAAFHAVTAISGALLERDRSGRGQTIEVSLYAAMYSALGSLGMRIHNVHSGPNQVINFVPLVRQYRCADGRWLQIHAFTRRAIRQFAIVAGVESWITEGILRLGPVIADAGVRAELQARLERLFATRGAQDWEDSLSAAGVSAAVCRTTSEWLEHPHTLESGLVRSSSTDGALHQPGLQVELSGESVAQASHGPSTAGASETIGAGSPGSTAPPLKGVRVLDLCIVLAGTTCGRTLAEYGADVIKIDDPNRDGGVIFHNDVNRGKRSLLLDLKSDAGKDVFWRLVDSADVVVENFRGGVVERLGIDYESVRQRRPGIVYVSLNTYGYRGPWSGRPGWEQLAEAATGMQIRYGSGGRPTLQPYAVLDFGTGLMAASGAMLALRQRRRTGVGQHVTTSLVATAGAIQSAVMNDPAADEAGGLDFRGPAWFHRFYEARDGWFFLAADPGRAEALGGAFGVAAFAAASDREKAGVLQSAVLPLSLETCLARVAEADAYALKVRSINDVMRDPWAVATGVSLQRDHGPLGMVDTIGPVPLLSRTALLAGRPATYPGIDASEVLLETGFSEADIAALVASGALVIPPVPNDEA